MRRGDSKKTTVPSPLELKVLQIVSVVIGNSLDSSALDHPLESLPNWDSLAHASLVFSLEEEFALTISPEQIDPTRETRAIARLVER